MANFRATVRSCTACLGLFLTASALPAREPVEAAPSPWLMMVMTKSTDPSRDVQFNTWYDDIDIPDVLQVPGYKRARRGRRLQLPDLPPADATDDGTYVALYDILSPNIDRTIIDMLMATRKMEAAGRSTDLLKVTERLYFRQLGAPVQAEKPQRPKTGQFLFLERVECCRDEATRAQLDDWYDTRHIQDMLAIPGFLRATRYELYRVLMIEPKSAPSLLTVYEISAETAAAVAGARSAMIQKLQQSGRLSPLFIERGSAVYQKINDAAAR